LLNTSQHGQGVWRRVTQGSNHSAVSTKTGYKTNNQGQIPRRNTGFIYSLSELNGLCGSKTSHQAKINFCQHNKWFTFSLATCFNIFRPVV